MKKKDIYFDTIEHFNEYYGFETLHPLVSVVRYDRPHAIRAATYHYGLYALFLKENKGCQITYGRTKYDFDEMTITSFAPGQVVSVEPAPGVTIPKWTAIVFHPDFLARTSLGREMSKYGFFSYNSNEALHLSAGEVEIVRSVLAIIRQEMHHAIDRHSRRLIVSNIEVLLNYCLASTSANSSRAKKSITARYAVSKICSTSTSPMKQKPAAYPPWQCSQTNAASRPDTSANW